MQVLTAFGREAATDTLNDVEGSIWWSVNRFVKRYGGDKDELFVEGQEAFLRAYERYDNTAGTQFASWVNSVVWYALLDWRRANVKYVERHRQFAKSTNDESESCQEEDLIPSRCCQFSTLGFIAELTEDARTVATLALERSERWQEVTGYRRVSLLRTMLSELGWASCRYWQAVKEIRTALT